MNYYQGTWHYTTTVLVPLRIGREVTVEMIEAGATMRTKKITAVVSRSLPVPLCLTTVPGTTSTIAMILVRIDNGARGRSAIGTFSFSNLRTWYCSFFHLLLQKSTPATYYTRTQQPSPTYRLSRHPASLEWIWTSLEVVTNG